MASVTPAITMVSLPTTPFSKGSVVAVTGSHASHKTSGRLLAPQADFPGAQSGSVVDLSSAGTCERQQPCQPCFDIPYLSANPVTTSMKKPGAEPSSSR
jgi:hypothetical protein